MTAVLDAGGLSALADPRRRALTAELLARGHLPALVSAAVLTEALTGDPRRDVATDRFLKGSLVLPVDEGQARHAAQLRTATGRAGTITAVDALVVALAAMQASAVIVTGDENDIGALAAQLAPRMASRVTVARV